MTQDIEEWEISKVLDKKTGQKMTLQEFIKLFDTLCYWFLSLHAKAAVHNLSGLWPHFQALNPASIQLMNTYDPTSGPSLSAVIEVLWGPFSSL